MKMYMYIGYELGILKHIITSNKLELPKAHCYECHTINEVINYLMEDNETCGDIIRLINDKDTFILKNWQVVISHKVLINYWGNKPQIWIENENGELELL